MSCATPSRASNPTLDDVKSRIPSRGAIRSTLVRPAGSAAFAGTVSMPRVSSDVTPRRCSVPRARARCALVAGSNRTAEGSSEGRSAPKWWDVGGRLNDAVQRDQRSEHGYLEHESTPVVLFDKRSNFNGRVRVVAHGPWRSLRFNDVEQGLTYVHGDWSEAEATGEPRATNDGRRATGAEMDPTATVGPRDGEADTEVLGYFYLRTMAAAAAAMCGLDGNLDLTQRGGRVVSIGLGTGALPAFIARKFPAAVVEVCEIDPVVVEAVRNFHGLPKLPKLPGPWGDKPVPGNLPPGVGVSMGDAGEFMERAARAVERGDAPTASVVFLDAFDGDGEVRLPEFLVNAARLNPQPPQTIVGKDDLRVGIYHRKHGTANTSEDALGKCLQTSVLPGQHSDTCIRLNHQPRPTALRQCRLGRLLAQRVPMHAARVIRLECVLQQQLPVARHVVLDAAGAGQIHRRKRGELCGNVAQPLMQSDDSLAIGHKHQPGPGLHA